ncbi:hypothetical protein [Nocardioides sp. R-C-SC26]|uniref:hypothetical protein n=1 Tax=Nocardioides sp. R-C-SC26 TaxID=2870414 RepID=UPI001E2FFB65|nr:hypothetical protein [Nocardioides sp. R-C-SC26]
MTATSAALVAGPSALRRFLAPWWSRHGVAAALVVVTTAIWRGVLLAGSYFNQDDFYLSGRAFRSDVTVEFLLRDTAGHVNPFQQLAYAALAHLAPYDWGLVAAFVLALQVGAIVVMWHLLCRLLPGRWVAVAMLAVFAWSPLTLATTLWWSAAMGLWPHVICSLLAVLFLVREHQGVGRRAANHAAILAAIVVGLLWHERAVLIPPVVAAVAVAMEDVSARSGWRSGWRRLRGAWRRHRPLWIVAALVVVGYLIAHSQLTTVEGGGGDLGASLSISWAFVGENVVPGLAGGPWVAEVDGGAVQPAVAVTVVSSVLAVALAGLLLWRGGPARRWALAFFVAYVLADLALVLAGRGGFGRVIGLDPRYSSDVVHAAVLFAAVALRGAPSRYGLGVDARRWALVRTMTVGSGVALYAAGSALGTAVLVPHFQNPLDREYLTTFRAELARDPHQVVLDELAPAEIVLPLVGEDSLLSRILGPLPEEPVFDQPSARLRQVTDEGNLVVVELDGAIPARPGPVEGCGYVVDADGTRVPMAAPLAGRVVIRAGYFTDRESTVEVSAGTWSAEFLARVGPNEIWWVLPDLEMPIGSVRLRVLPGPDDADESDEGAPTLCVTALEAGLPAVGDR